MPEPEERQDSSAQSKKAPPANLKSSKGVKAAKLILVVEWLTHVLIAAGIASTISAIMASVGFLSNDDSVAIDGTAVGERLEKLAPYIIYSALGIAVVFLLARVIVHRVKSRRAAKASYVAESLISTMRISYRSALRESVLNPTRRSK